MPPSSAREWIAALALAPHPEGGFYREIYRSPLMLETPRGPRSASTAIYYLLEHGDFSALHRVASDELWHHYAGGPLELHTLSAQGEASSVILGDGHAAVHVVPAGVWQAARPVGAFALAGCTVAPGFDFADFEMPPREQLLARYPEQSELIRSLTRPPGSGS